MKKIAILCAVLVAAFVSSCKKEKPEENKPIVEIPTPTQSQYHVYKTTSATSSGFTVRNKLHVTNCHFLNAGLR